MCMRVMAYHPLSEAIFLSVPLHITLSAILAMGGVKYDHVAKLFRCLLAEYDFCDVASLTTFQHENVREDWNLCP